MAPRGGSSSAEQRWEALETPNGKQSHLELASQSGTGSPHNTTTTPVTQSTTERSHAPPAIQQHPANNYAGGLRKPHPHPDLSQVSNLHLSALQLPPIASANLNINPTTTHPISRSDSFSGWPIRNSSITTSCQRSVLSRCPALESILFNLHHTPTGQEAGSRTRKHYLAP